MTSAIHKGLLWIGYFSVVVFLVLAPFFSVYAQGGAGGAGGGGAGGAGGGGAGGGSGLDSAELQNPLKFDTLTELLGALLDIVMVFAVPIIVFFLILGGFKYVMAQGNSEAIGKATKMITWTLVGGVIVLGAWALVEVIQGTVDALR